MPCDPRRTLITPPDAISFLPILEQRGFQRPRDLTTTISIHSLHGLVLASSTPDTILARHDCVQPRLITLSATPRVANNLIEGLVIVVPHTTRTVEPTATVPLRRVVTRASLRDCRFSWSASPCAAVATYSMSQSRRAVLLAIQHVQP